MPAAPTSHHRHITRAQPGTPAPANKAEYVHHMHSRAPCAECTSARMHVSGSGLQNKTIQFLGVHETPDKTQLLKQQLCSSHFTPCASYHGAAQLKQGSFPPGGRHRMVSGDAWGVTLGELLVLSGGRGAARHHPPTVPRQASGSVPGIYSCPGALNLHLGPASSHCSHFPTCPPMPRTQQAPQTGAHVPGMQAGRSAA